MKRLAIFAGFLCATLGAREAAALSPFTVFFRTGSSALDVYAKAILDQAAMAWRVSFAGVERPDVEIHAHADRKGPAESNRRLSCLRAKAVRSYLVSRGIPAERIVAEGWGELRPIVDTPDEVEEPQNRYAAVLFNAPGTNRRFRVNSYRC